VPLMPPAPTAFSITIGCFSVALMEVPSRRAMMSPGPPAENGRMRVIGRLGYSARQRPARLKNFSSVSYRPGSRFERS
jgi:hypothetical protein